MTLGTFDWKMSVLEELSSPMTSPSCTGRLVANVLTPVAVSAAGPLVPAPVNCRFGAGRSTRSRTWPGKLAVFTAKLVTAPSKGATSAAVVVVLNGTYVQFVSARQM